MFDLSLSKLALIGVVALVVIGPEKLPKVARMAGTLFGRARRYVDDVKAEVGRDMALDELKAFRQDVEGAVQDIQGSLAQEPCLPADPAHNPAIAAVKARQFKRQKQSRLPLRHGRRIVSDASRMASARERGTSRSSFDGLS